MAPRKPVNGRRRAAASSAGGVFSGRLTAQASSTASTAPRPKVSSAATARRAILPALGAVMRAFFRAPERAAEPVVALACSPELAGETGVYLHMLRRKAMDPRATDPAFGRALWERCDELLAPHGPAVQ